MAKTLARSGKHRMVLMGYFGIALAVVLSGVAEIAPITRAPDRTCCSPASRTCTWGCCLFLLLEACGIHSAFPWNCGANWTFQITEREGRAEWLRAVDRLAVVPAILVIVIAPISDRSQATRVARRR